jgi:diaminopimelate epimerase
VSALHKLTLTRMAGAGNTFFVVSSEVGTREERAAFVREVCNDYVGFSTDGFLFLQAHKDSDALWDFYNADGSHAEMCGNAARCAALFYHDKMKAQERIRFHTAAGPIEAQIVDAEQGLVRVKMPVIKTDHGKNHGGEHGGKEVKIGTRQVRGYFVNTGVPHFVIQSEPDEELARALRKSDAFGPQGANITFVEFDETDFIQAVTFERGVEGFTLACGTGAVAAARFHHECEPHITTQTVEMPGGLLQVSWEGEQAHLTGPAEFHFELQLHEDHA